MRETMKNLCFWNIYFKKFQLFSSAGNLNSSKGYAYVPALSMYPLIFLGKAGLLIQALTNLFSTPPFLQGLYTKFPSGFLMLWMVPNSIYTMFFFLNMHPFDKI
jgi:hypothetical protein